MTETLPRPTDPSGTAHTDAGGYTLADRYRPGARPVLLTGVQAVARLLVEQHARDARAGWRTASLVSGYPGSPLAGLDKTLMGVPALREEHGVHLVPGLNEELGATAVWGSQLEPPQGRRTHDGVVGVWYGKGPGLDRSGDVLRHASLYGAHPRGGALVLTGDDPGAKSSTVPYVSERTLAALGIPVLYPRSAAEIVTLGLHGVALSRASGCWVALRIVADVADGLFTVDEDFGALQITVPALEWQGRPWAYRQRVMAAPADSLLAEEDLVGPRWSMVEAYAAANPLDVVEVDPARAWLGIAAPGAQFDAVRQALLDLGLDDAALHRTGIRLLRIGMPYPLGGATLRHFARGLDELLVVEEKAPFIETQVRDLLYGTARAPRVLGKRGRDGEVLIPAGGAVTADRLTGALRSLLHGLELAAPRAPRRPLTLSITPVQRAPYFCSGCPHNRSTVLPEGSIGGGGIGCHTMVTLAPRETSQVTGLTQMGGEGAQWIGQAPFTDVPHIFQNIGDGTYFHSGQLAVQACVAAGVNITYKILFNQVVAMTGAQHAQGALEVPALTRKLHAEGVEKIIVCAEDPRRYGRQARFAPGTLVWDRDRLDEAQRLLRDVPGVTVLIYDQQCAAEARRLRKRGQLPARTTRVVINEAVCEGCGDCGVKSNCLSVQPVETEFGRKTRIDQTSCNTDYSCLDGDCPSFLTVELPRSAAAARRTPPAAPAVPDPQLPQPSPTFEVFLAGIGGTGIVTVNAILATAALHEGLRSVGLDQTGLSQKAGPVTSHLRLTREDAAAPANRVSAGSADVVLAFDLMVGSDARYLPLAAPDRTTVVASTSRTPTGEMVYDPSVRYPDEGAMLARLSGGARRTESLDALAAAEALFGSTEVANLLLVGAAFQAGALPMSAASLEKAIELNGVAVALNLAAFRWGRVSVADPAAFAAATRPAARTRPLPDGSAFVEGRALAEETRRLTAIRAAGMADHSGPRAGHRYAELVERAALAERRVGDRTAFSEAVARGAHRLGAYKDEYEVARLLTDRGLEQEALAQVPGATSLTYRLHPPALRSAGLDRKIALGPAFRPALRVLARAKRLRGTPLDPFGFARIRRIERALAAEYTGTIDRLAAQLDADSYDTAVAVAEAAELVRGYEGVKLASVERYRQHRAELGVPLGDEVLRLLPAQD
ncbi:indolepyruvate ferredoxin oxidoreductase family protein [Geodermatophilus ruber]|uniref:Indolepyruvate ferredoxin oxidoreductase n=1 Tax=Geodermatophilus ruber TaxID=504800 RepID=A0A1I4GLA0_9ACTN|nr:indolepyruvate ferredoxin oxidoreductase family protein [Geodermatophilus ruber]SFL30828.1 indolepyruvate ferredoxin oxidoreductase [Geodermatophilus ruber]